VPRAEPPWHVQCLLGLSAWLATLLLLLFVAFSNLITTEGGALVNFEINGDGNVTAWRVGKTPQVDYVEGCS